MPRGSAGIELAAWPDNPSHTLWIPVSRPLLDLLQGASLPNINWRVELRPQYTLRDFKSCHCCDLPYRDLTTPTQFDFEAVRPKSPAESPLNRGGFEKQRELPWNW